MMGRSNTSQSFSESVRQVKEHKAAVRNTPRSCGFENSVGAVGRARYSVRVKNSQRDMPRDMFEHEVVPRYSPSATFVAWGAF